MARTVSQEIPLQEIDLAAPVRVGDDRAAGDRGRPIRRSRPVGNIGSLALQAMAVTVDQRNRRVRIAPQPAEARDSPYLSRLALAARPFARQTGRRG